MQWNLACWCVVLSVGTLLVAKRSRRVLELGCGFLPQLKPTEAPLVVLELMCLAELCCGEKMDFTLSSAESLLGTWLELASSGLVLALGLGNTVALVHGKKNAGIGLKVWPLAVCLISDAQHIGFISAALVASFIYAVLWGEGDSSGMFAFVPNQHLDFMRLGHKRKPQTESTARVVILTMGSRGDVQPFIALAQRLKKSGKINPHIVSMGAYKQLVERYGIEFSPCGMEDLQLENGLWREATHIRQVISLVRNRAAKSFSSVGKSFYQACQGCDLIIATNTTSLFGLSIAEKLGVPCVSVKLAPDAPTRAFSPSTHHTSRWGLVNLLRWYWYFVQIGLAARRAALVDPETGETLEDPETKFRREVLDLPPLGGGKRLAQLQNGPTLCAFSNTLVPKPKDWPVNYLVTGWWYVDTETGKGSNQVKGSAMDDLDAFLCSSVKGSPVKPFCINFGSMTAAAKQLGLVKTVLLGLAALEPKEPVAVVLVDSTHTEEDMGLYEEIAKGSLRVHVIKDIPHDLLFPRCCAVVHHGGAGTTARVLQFGIPSIVIPVMLWTDQPLWADRVEGLGAGLHVDRADPAFDKHLAVALHRIGHPENEFIGSAGEIARALSAEEDGLVKTTEFILNFFSFTST